MQHDHKGRRSALSIKTPALDDFRYGLTVEKLNCLPRSQFLRQQAGFKKKARRFGGKAKFSVCGDRSELAMATRSAICPA
jgi:hypothetical protein